LECIDLNGFPIAGPCQVGTGIGINAPDNANVTVSNGTVSCMGEIGVRVGTLNRGARVEPCAQCATDLPGFGSARRRRSKKHGCTERTSRGHPEQPGCRHYRGSRIRHPQQRRNGKAGSGIYVFSGSVIRGNVAFDNATINIIVFCASTVIDNSASGSLAFGPATCVMSNNS
jgi:hypothetical protein